MEAQIIVCGPPIHPSEPLYSGVWKQKRVSKLHKTTFLLSWPRPWPDFLWNQWAEVLPLCGRNFIPYLEVWCNLAPVSGWLTWIRGNFYIILTNSTNLRHAKADHLKILTVIVFFVWVFMKGELWQNYLQFLHASVCVCSVKTLLI